MTFSDIHVSMQVLHVWVYPCFVALTLSPYPSLGEGLCIRCPFAHFGRRGIALTGQARGIESVALPAGRGNLQK